MNIEAGVDERIFDSGEIGATTSLSPIINLTVRVAEGKTLKTNVL